VSSTPAASKGLQGEGTRKHRTARRQESGRNGGKRTDDDLQGRALTSVCLPVARLCGGGSESTSRICCALDSAATMLQREPVEKEPVHQGFDHPIAMNAVWAATQAVSRSSLVEGRNGAETESLYAVIAPESAAIIEHRRMGSAPAGWRRVGDRAGAQRFGLLQAHGLRHAPRPRRFAANPLPGIHGEMGCKRASCKTWSWLRPRWVLMCQRLHEPRRPSASPVTPCSHVVKRPFRPRRALPGSRLLGLLRLP